MERKNNMNKIIFGGCSFVQGYSMKNDNKENKSLLSSEQEKKRFSYLLSEKLKITEVNLAATGGSNQRAIRQIYEWINKNKKDVKNNFFIIGLTELFRSEKFSSQTQSYIKWRKTIFLENLKKINNIKDNIHTLIPSSFDFVNYVIENDMIDNLINYTKTEILLFTDTNYELKKLIQDLEMISAYIEKHGGYLIVFSSMLELDVFKFNESNFDFHFMRFPNGETSWRDFICSYDRYYSKSNHPSAKDNEILADLLFNEINNLNKI